MAGPDKVAELYIETQLRVEKLEADAKRGERAIDRLGESARKAEEGIEGTGTAADTSSTSVGRFGVAAGAAATAIGLLAAKTITLGLDLDKSSRSIAASSAALRDNVEGVKDALHTVSKETGRSLREVGQVGAAVARDGVESLGEFTARLKVASDLAKVTGAGFEAAAQGLDQLLDVFRLAPGDTERVAAALFSLTEQGVPLEDLFRALEQSAPALQEFGIGFEEAARAIAGMLQRNGNPRQVAQQFRELASQGAEGRAELERLAATAPVAADGLERFGDALKIVNGGLGEQAKGALAGVESNLAKIGDHALRAVAPVVSLTAKLLDLDAANEKASRSFLEGYFRGGGLFITGQGQPTAPSNPLTTSTPLFVTPGGTSTRAPDRESDAQRRKREREAEQAVREAEQRIQRMRDEGKRAAEDIVNTAATLLNDVIGGPIGDLLNLARDLRLEMEKVKPLGDVAFAKAKADAETAFRAAVLTVDEFIEAPKKLPGGGPLDADLILKQIDYTKQLQDLQRQGTAQRGKDAAEIADQDARHDRERLERLTDNAQAIDAAVLAALDLAEAFGIADQNVLGILSSLSQVATGVSPLVEAIKLGGASNILTAAIPVAGGVASLVSGLSAAFGDSPELKAAREAIEKNIDALKDNTRGLRDLDLTGSQISGGRSGLQRFFDEGLPPLRTRSRISPTQITNALDAFGVSMEDLRDLAAEMGLEFVELNRDTIPQFLTFLEQLGVQLDRVGESFFGTDARGRLDRVETDIAFSPEVESAGETFRRMVEAAFGGGKGASIIAGAFLDFDWSALSSADPEIRAQAEEAARNIIRTLYETVTGEGFDLSLLGDFSPQGFLDLLGDLLGLIPETLEESAEEIRTAAEQWADAMANVGRTVDVFDLSDLDAFNLWIEELRQVFPELADALASFDLSTPEGIQAAIQYFQDWLAILLDSEAPIEGLGFDLEAMGLSVDDLIGGLNLLKGAFRDATTEAERLADEARRTADEQRREAERQADALQRQREEERRAAQRAHEEALRRIEERRRAELALGADTLRALEEMFDLQGITDVVDQLAQRIALLSKQSPAFATLFEGIDAGDAGSRAEAFNRLRDFQLANPFGVESGKLSADTVRSEVLAIAQILRSLDTVEVTSTEGTVGSFAIDRSITELRGERLEGLLATGNIWLEEIAANTALMASLVTPFDGLTPPAIPAAFGAGAAVQIGTVAFHLPGGGIVDGGALSPATLIDLGAIVARIIDETNLRDLGAG